MRRRSNRHAVPVPHATPDESGECASLACPDVGDRATALPRVTPLFSPKSEAAFPQSQRDCALQPNVVPTPFVGATLGRHSDALININDVVPFGFCPQSRLTIVSSLGYYLFALQEGSWPRHVAEALRRRDTLPDDHCFPEPPTSVAWAEKRRAPGDK
jgi:hypothetical protein